MKTVKYVVILALLLAFVACGFACQSEANKYLNEAISHYENGQVIEALRSLEMTYGKEPADADYFVRRAGLYIELNEYGGARADYEEAILLDPTAESYTELGKLYSITEIEEALNCFNQAILIDPQYAEAYLWRGKKYQEWGYYSNDRDEALERLNKAVIDITESIELVSDKQYQAARALVYIDLGLYDEAIEDYSECIRQKPKARYYYGRASAYFLADRLSLAINDLNEAINLEPSYYEAYYNRGIVYMVLENYLKAIADFNKLVEAMPEWGFAYLLRLTCFVELGDIEAATDDYNSALRLDAYSEEYFDLPDYIPANTKLYLSKIDNAIKELEMALDDNAQ